MTHSTNSNKAQRADSNPAGGSVLREVFAATPLAIFIDALNGNAVSARYSRR